MVKQENDMVQAVQLAVCTIIFFLLTVTAAVADTGGSLKTVHVSLAAAEGMATIEDGSSILFVDYKRGLMSRWQSSTGGCVQYNISNSGQEDSELKDRIRLFSEIERLPDEEEDFYPVRLMLAPAAMKTRTVTTPKLVWHDFVFQPDILQFKMAADSSIFRDLQEIAKINKVNYDTIGLTHWYDIVALIPYLGGVPEMARNRQFLFTYSFTLMSYNAQQSQLTALCGKQ